MCPPRPPADEFCKQRRVAVIAASARCRDSVVQTLRLLLDPRRFLHELGIRSKGLSLFLVPSDPSMVPSTLELSRDPTAPPTIEPTALPSRLNRASRRRRSGWVFAKILNRFCRP